MKKDDSVYLHHILAAIERIETYSEGVSLQKFLDTGIIQDEVGGGYLLDSSCCGPSLKGLKPDGLAPLKPINIRR